MTRYNSNLTPEQSQALIDNFNLGVEYIGAMQKAQEAEKERNTALSACMHGTRNLTDQEAHELLQAYKDAEVRYLEAKENQETAKKALDDSYRQIIESRILA